MRLPRVLDKPTRHNRSQGRSLQTLRKNKMTEEYSDEHLMIDSIRLSLGQDITYPPNNGESRQIRAVLKELKKEIRQEHKKGGKDDSPR